MTSLELLAVFMKKEMSKNTSTTPKTNQYIQIEDEPEPLYNLFDKAYKTKIGRAFRPSKSHKFVSQSKYMLHQIHPHGTWLVDLVKFGDYWYVFFVEANTRYLIVIQGNSDFLNSDSVLVNRNKRVPSDIFLEVFQRFEEMNAGHLISMLIGDSEKAFWSIRMRDYYKRHNIRICIINVSTSGHLGMSILDRLVKTIIDICHRMKFSQSVTPKEMIDAVVVYNNTVHSTFSKLVGENWTPLMVHNNSEYEHEFTKALMRDNWRITAQPAFDIRIGTQVVVRDENPHQRKIRSRVVEGDCIVASVNMDGTYNLKNRDDDSTLSNVPRRNLRPIY